MLTLTNITKDYIMGDEAVHALRGVSLKFRPHEFVAILGPSGCGKTTLLNIIGGLDHYTDGDLIISGTSTKEYKDRDWDAYRNHRVGFVFQSYNLIPHQTVSANVELALTLSGISRTERRVRAAAALENVGLGEQLKKKPGQLSGGQMQRVAIARALVNDPDIILADEPTGALDTVTSEQIMEILRSVSDKKLIVMVTHNPELAEQYATRIIRVKDGLVIEDTNPYDGEEITAESGSMPEANTVAAPVTETAPAAANGKKKKGEKRKKERTSMSFLTALSLSLNNLMTKKARTILTSFAGSIGIIGIALILALSEGIQAFIDRVQEDTLSTYPLQIEEQAMDLTTMLAEMAGTGEKLGEVEDGYIGSNDQLAGLATALGSSVKENDLASFKKYADTNEIIQENAIVQYRYGVTPFAYAPVKDKNGNITTYTSVNPSQVYSLLMGQMGMDTSMVSTSVWTEMITSPTNTEEDDETDILKQQYDLLGENSRWPEKYDEVLLVVDENRRISDLNLYALGFKPQEELYNLLNPNNTSVEKPEPTYYTYDDILKTTFRVVPGVDCYEKQEDGTYVDLRQTELKTLVESRGFEVKVVGIVAKKPEVTAASISGAIAYLPSLTEYLVSYAAETNPDGTYRHEIVQEQVKNNPKVDVLTGRLFYEQDTSSEEDQIRKLLTRIGALTGDAAAKDIPVASNKELAEQYKLNAERIASWKMYVAEVEALKAQYSSEAASIEQSIADIYNNQLMGRTVIPPMGGNPGVDILSWMIGTGTEYTAIAMTRVMELYPQFLGQITDINDMEGILESYFVNLKAFLDDTTVGAQKRYNTVCDICAMLFAHNAAKYGPQLEETKKNTDETIMANDYKAMVTWVATKDGTEYRYPSSVATGIWDTLCKTGTSDSTYKQNLRLLGYANSEVPTAIYIYPKSFDGKKLISAQIDLYNEANKDNPITTTDLVGVMLSGIGTIINVIRYVLIAFVSVSLVVSSIMIGIITYISVLERIKEIGVLRAIGASKRNVSQVFLAEALIVGFTAGVIGILVTLLLCIPIDLIIGFLSDGMNVATKLPFGYAVVLIAISTLLTLVAGLIPSRIAAKKEPVDALRSE